MALSSMTGFARSHGVSGPYAWAWELKSVNAKGLELRLRLPPGWDAVETPVRAKAAELLSRGTVQGTLTVTREGVVPVVRVNEAVLSAVIETLRDLAERIEASPPTLDGILAMKGVVEVSDQDEREDERLAAEAAVVAGCAGALEALAAMRRHEGVALGTLLNIRLDEIAMLTARAEAAPGRRPEAIKARLAEQIAAILGSSDRFDADRLHQEALLMASKADIREELDRLVAHVAQARSLLKQGGAVGRRLDFLAQELHRESNTLCAKANDIELTNIGLGLKSVVEQFREQVQNLE
ncbi:MAG TPA: YicC/YloC family endoribonuclease [Xanthobacteraceae bacterium]|nr:YicC/YloC family endoribonuclease [Xanthobacteraceae bacterium]